MEQLKIGKKFTVAGMGFNSDELKEIVAENPKSETALLNVYALVSAVKVETNRIDSTKTSNRFIGQFEVTNVVNGETGVFAEAFFPGVIDSYVSGIKGTTEGNAVMAFTITVEKDLTKNSAQGYKFGLLALVNKSEEADPFKSFRGLLTAPKTAAKAIAAPEKSATKKK